MNGCPMLDGDPPRTCDWCDTNLPRRKDGKPHRNRRWCSDPCRDGWVSNHVWQVARKAALERDRWTCVWCGVVGWRDVPSNLVRVRIRPADPTGYPAALMDYAQAWGFGPPGATAWSDLAPHAPESILELARAERDMQVRSRGARRVGGVFHDLEVDHIEPADGVRTASCIHHLDNLRTLCISCHRTRTAAQRRGVDLDGPPDETTQMHLLEASALDLPAELDPLALGETA